MLKNELITWCSRGYDQSSAGHCGCGCDNKEHCNHDCDGCLKQVHWYPEYGGRYDYTCFNLLLRYVVRFTKKYSQQIHDALDFVDISQYPYFNILSIGCGAAPDLMAFEEIAEDKSIYYKGYDRNPLWETIHNRITKYTETTPNITAKLRRKDIFDVFFDGMPEYEQYNVVVIQYLLSHLYNTGQKRKTSTLFQGIIDNIISNRPQNSPFLIIITDIDSRNKGRSNWFVFLDMLEAAGFSGNVYARSAYSDSDLGKERWSYHKSSWCFGNISYTFEENASKSDGAQLVIELR